MAEWRIIAVSGCTNGGKTTLSKHLQDAFPGSVSFNQDLFFRQDDDPHHQWIQLSNGIRHQNWELLDSIDWDDYTKEVLKTLSVPPPRSNCLLILEGHLVLNYPAFPFDFEKKYYLTLDKDDCWQRRKLRNYVPADPPKYFEEIVWPMSVKNKEEVLARHKDVTIISGTLPQNEILDLVLSDLQKHDISCK